jgi:hypothetical protein
VGRSLLIYLAWMQVGLAAAAAQAQPIAGRVVGADGRPVGAAFVSVLDRDSSGKDQIFAAVQSGVDGSFSLNASGSHEEIVADVPGVGMTKPMALDAAVPLTLCATTELRLTFIRPDGKPAAADVVRPVLVRWVGGADSPFGPWIFLPAQVVARWEKQTDKDGTVGFAGFPSSSVVRFELDDDRFAQSMDNDVEITGDGGVSKLIHLSAAADVSGTVTYSDSGNAATGLRIYAQSVIPGPSGGGEAVTDAAGHYDIKRLAAAQYAVGLHPVDVLKDWCAAADVVDARPGAENQANLSLIHGGIVTGKVRDEVSGKGLAGLNVGLHGPAHPMIAAAIQMDTTDADGTFTLRVPPGAQFVYLAMAPPEGYLLPPPSPTSFQLVGGGHESGQLHADVDVKEGQTVTVNLDLPRDPSPLVKGRVVDSDGDPAAGAIVLFDVPPARGKPPTVVRGVPAGFKPSVQADSEGQFQLHAPVGTLLMARFKEMATETAVKTRAGGAYYTLSVAAGMTFDLLVRVIDENGAPIGGSSVIVRAQMNGGGPVESHPVPAGAVAEIDGLATDTPWRILALAPGYAGGDGHGARAAACCASTCGDDGHAEGG